MLPLRAVKEFGEIYQKEESKNITQVEATILANNLMSLFKTLVKPKLDRGENK